ncbi:phosphotransferase family protein [Tsuneonella sp. CC-YZS046]|uniref:phosphotransferase family protein n=1 Tax=Tsuneonella sp. CC-YZS046 TaxID=3042152 RepID=UPI002D76F749|nr:phosphotransferase family protein [Tsuneonella sp. CC-YZS046]WRO65554.1 phosphotransferase family protein [Tsuneonella sp. CC-YZS046]
MSEGLSRLLAEEGGAISDVRRMSGGASKEQFLFIYDGPRGREQLVLRMDPLEGLLETCRRREAQVLRAMRDVVPVPEVLYVDADGSALGLPGLVTSFVSGVAKPPQAAASVSGLRTDFDEGWRALLAPAFMDNLIRIHGFDFRSADLPDFAVPDADPLQPALRQVNWWALAWRDDVVDAFPIMAIAEGWMRENLPACNEPVLVHGDYRTGNYLFDPEDGRVTAVLDWELAHIGDFHEDLAWNLQPIFANKGEDGRERISGLFTREDFLEGYERHSGRVIDPKTLHFYNVLNAWKCAVIDLSSCLTAARDGNNHQDVLLSWLATSAHMVLDHLAELLAEDIH